MKDQLTQTEDPNVVAKPMQDVMGSLRLQPDPLLREAMDAGTRMRRRRRAGSALAVALVVAVLGGIGVAGVSRLPGVGSPARPAADPTVSAVPAPAGPDGLDAHAAALYLARMLPGTPTAYFGDDSIEPGLVVAKLSYDGHSSQRKVGGQLQDLDDVLVRVQSKDSWTHEYGRGTLLSCDGRRYLSCRVSQRADGSTLLTATEGSASGCCEIRGDVITLAQALRPDETLISAYGRADHFSPQLLNSVVEDPIWSLTPLVSAADQAAADALAPWAPSGPIATR